MAISQQYALLFARLATDNLVECLPLLTEHHRRELLGRLFDIQAPRFPDHSLYRDQEKAQLALNSDNDPKRGGV